VSGEVCAKLGVCKPYNRAITLVTFFIKLVPRRVFIAALFALPFLWVGTWAYAEWVDPNCAGVPAGETCPPWSQIPGVAWLFPAGSTARQTGDVRISGEVNATGRVSAETGYFVPLAAGAAVSAVQTGTGTDALYAYAPAAGKFAGDFVGRLRIDNSDVAAGAGCIQYDGTNLQYSDDCATYTNFGSGAAGSLWSLQTGTTNIFKGTATDLTGIVAIGTATPTTGGFPTGTRLALVGEASPNGPRLFIDSATGNPELDLELSSTAGDHWGLYVDKTSRDFRLWAKDTASGTGADRFSLTSHGVVVFGGWSAVAYTLTIASGAAGSGTVSGGGINCTITNGVTSGTCSIIASGSVILTATATGTSSFGGFSGGGCSTSPCAVSMSGSLTVTASFTPPGVPTVLTDAAGTPVTSTSVPLNGHLVSANGSGGTLAFVVANAVNTNYVTCNGTNFALAQGSPLTKSFLSTDANVYFNKVWVPSPALASGTWQYCIFGTNSSGTTYGNIMTFVVAPPAPTAPVISLPTVTSITSSGATLGATVTSNGGAALTARGTCWGTSPAPVTNCVADGSTATGVFTQVRTGLAASTFYYYRGYATNSVGTSYTSDATFSTTAAPTAPAISSPTSANLTSSSAVLGANVTADGGASVTDRGTCWGLSANPASNCLSQGSGLGVFTHTRSGLAASTLYHYRGYATNSVGTSYTSDATFTTAAPPTAPTLTTPTVSSITSSGATLGATVTSNGGAALTARGTCWGTSPAPVTNCVADGGTSVSAFTQARAGMAASTFYYYRGYATNSVGTGYSSDGTFTTSAPAVVPTIASPLTPAQGSQAEFYTVTITGTNLTNVTSINFTKTGSIGTVSNIISNGTSVTFDLDIDVAASVGFWNVSVTTPGGTSNVLISAFRVLLAL